MGHGDRVDIKWIRSEPDDVTDRSSRGGVVEAHLKYSCVQDGEQAYARAALRTVFANGTTKDTIEYY